MNRILNEIEEKKNTSLLFLLILGIRAKIMSIEMTTKTPQRSDWSLEEGITVERQHSFTTNKENNAASINTWIDVNKDQSRIYEKTK
jgi:hypothetical protein